MLRKRLGSSPRVWGQGLTPHTLGSVVPIIPTRVGTRLLLSFLSSSGTYHPHACGDKIRRLNIVKMHQVSSPRVWGQGLSALGFRLFLGIIPTRVGTRKQIFQICTMNTGSSPRVWGQDINGNRPEIFIGIIPTRVGTRKQNFCVVMGG